MTLALLKIALLTAGISLSVVAFAQQQEGEAPASFEEATEPEATNAEQTDQEQAENVKSEEPVAKQAEPEKITAEPEQPSINPDASFTPTEEISEDKPVAFPVDI